MRKQPTPLHIVPNYFEWQEVIAEFLNKHAITENDIGMVLYTDGGSKNYTGGWGIHGYVYANIPPKVGHGTKQFVPTEEGYLNYEGNKKPENEITVVFYIDACGSSPGATNNGAEVSAAINAFKIFIDLKVKKILLKMDSEYAREGINEMASRWQAAGWRRGDGNPVANKTLWEELLELQSYTRENNFVIATQWVKGHSTHVGNIRADALATSGIHATFQNLDHIRVSFSKPTKYWSPDKDISKFLNEAHWYFDTQFEEAKQLNGLYLYHLGDHGPEDEDDEIAKPHPEKSFAVVALKEPEPVLEKIRRFQIDSTPDLSSYVIMARLRNIFKPVVYKELSDYGTIYLDRPRHSPTLVNSTKLSITKMSDPPFRAYEAMDTLEHMTARLAAVVNGKLPEKYLLTDISHLIYEQEDTKKGPVWKVILPMSELTSLKVDVDYYTPTGSKKCNIPLILGIDIPRRNFFSGVSTLKPKVMVLTWREPCSAEAFRYATVVICENGECGIWEGAYSNLRIVF